jgi:hypothetical protein
VTRGAKPYLVPEPGAISLGGWQMLNDDDWVDLGDQVDGWDTGTDLRIRREVRVDWARVREEAGLDAGAQLRATVSWASSTTTMRGIAGSVPVPTSGLMLFDGVLPGDRVAGVLDLRTTVCVAADAPSSPGVAQTAGAILHEERWRLALEGTGSMFPVSVIDFARTVYDPDASWHLETSVDLDAPFMGRFLLSLNSRDTELVEAVSARSRTPRQESLVEELHHGVAQLLLRLAEDVNVEDPLDDREFAADTVGDILSRTLSAVDTAPPTSALDPADVSARRSRLEGSTRRTGHGRAFK